MFPRQLKQMRWTDVFTFTFFVVLAAAIWFGHAMQSVRNAIVPVLVSYTGAPSNIGFAEDGLPDTIQIEVRDAGQRLGSYFREPLHLTIDLHPYIHGDRGSVRIPADALRNSLNNLLQGTSRLITAVPEEITCPYYTEQEKNIPIRLTSRLTTATEYQLVDKPTLSRKTIKVYGAASKLDAIDSIPTALLTLDNLVDTTNVRVALLLPKGVRSIVDSVDVRIIAERYTEKKVTVPLRVEGVPDGYHVRLFPREVEVSLRVGLSHFSQVTQHDVRAVCRYSADRTDKLDVELRYTNPYITSAWAYPAAVEFILEQ